VTRRNVIFAVAAFVALLASSELALTVPILGIGPDLAIIVLAAYAIGERPRTAATAGFALGLARDLLLTTPKGVGALAYALTAYAVALLGMSRSAPAVIGTVVGATLMSQLIFGLGAVLLAPQLDASPLPRVILVTTAYNALVAPLLMPLLRRVIQRETAPQSRDL
jgi:rod shape-determining protein MreD